jgi:hypothetical protein
VARAVHRRGNVRLLVALLAISGCGLERLTSDVHLHQQAAAQYQAVGDQAGAARELKKVEQAQIKLQRREYGVPPMQFPL